MNYGAQKNREAVSGVDNKGWSVWDVMTDDEYYLLQNDLRSCEMILYACFAAEDMIEMNDFAFSDCVN